MIKKIIVHCTDTPPNRHVTAAEIDQWHRANGWDGIGYHYVVRLSGLIEMGRPERKMGAHTRGHNQDSIGVVYVGGQDHKGNWSDTRTDSQKASLLYLIGFLKRKHPMAEVYGHCDFSSKACPCFDARKEYAGIAEFKDDTI